MVVLFGIMSQIVFLGAGRCRCSCGWGFVRGLLWAGLECGDGVKGILGVRGGGARSEESRSLIGLLRRDQFWNCRDQLIWNHRVEIIQSEIIYLLSSKGTLQPTVCCDCRRDQK